MNLEGLINLVNNDRYYFILKYHQENFVVFTRFKVIPASDTVIDSVKRIEDNVVFSIGDIATIRKDCFKFDKNEKDNYGREYPPSPITKIFIDNVSYEVMIDTKLHKFIPLQFAELVKK